MEVELLKLANILLKLRRTTKYWQEHYGSQNKQVMKVWEDKADEWLQKNIIES